MIQKGIISFDCSKNELFDLSDNYKTVHRKLKANWKVELNEKELTKEYLLKVNIFVIAGPQEKFTEDEFKILKEFIENGGHLLIMLGEGGENEFNTNINFFLEEYGMSINNDCVVRPHYYKNFHPKECTIGGGVVCETISRYLLNENIEKVDYEFSDNKYQIQFQYPYGATLNITEPSNILITTGPIIYPFNRPLTGYYCNEKFGKILAIGSGHMFHDKYILDSTNELLFEYFINLLYDNTIQFTNMDFNDIEVNDNKFINDIGYISELPKACLIESAANEIPTDIKKIFNMDLYSLSSDLLIDVINLYQQLNVEYEQLRIIKPQFEIPLPSLQLAVFSPIFSEPQPPPLELFDLDEAFSSPRTQIGQLTSKCLASIQETNHNLKSSTTTTSFNTNNTKELEYFIRECGRISGILPSDGQQIIDAKEILYKIGVKIANYKKIDRE